MTGNYPIPLQSSPHLSLSLPPSFVLSSRMHPLLFHASGLHAERRYSLFSSLSLCKRSLLPSMAAHSLFVCTIEGQSPRVCSGHSRCLSHPCSLHTHTTPCSCAPSKLVEPSLPSEPSERSPPSRALRVLLSLRSLPGTSHWFRVLAPTARTSAAAPAAALQPPPGRSRVAPARFPRSSCSLPATPRCSSPPRAHQPARVTPRVADPPLP